MSERITPKYLTREIAEAAVSLVIREVLHDKRMYGIVNGHMCYVVILVPSVKKGRQVDDVNWPDNPITPHCLYEIGIGDRTDWSYEFDRIARNKALQLWRGQSFEGNTDPMPHLLFSNDTPFWGGVKRHGIVVAVSGVQSFFDEMLSGMIADTIRGLACFHFEKGGDKREGNSFLS
ncbi:hypothetical protein AU467_20140 [Mesorhizobium loti]|uniref:Uncharacterized protein n=1 Tax=Rhizobium loti TaxID=381 RepID=A0A101KTC5_RHILI|nr:hypothetical protein AU467_20140 [Mesorhizobium loti]